MSLDLTPRHIFTSTGLGTPALGGSILIAALAVFIALKVVLMLVLAANVQYLMDEYAVASQAPLVDRLPYQDVWPNRTILYAYFYRLALWFGADSIEVMRAARIGTAAVSLASLGVLYAVARQIGRGRAEALLVVAVALGFSSFMERAFMVRPEPLSLLLALVALWVSVRWPDVLKACLFAGAVSGIAFLTTQKAVYFNLALGLALGVEGISRGSLARALGAGSALVVGWSVALGTYVGAFFLAGAAPLAILDNIFLGAARQNAAYGHLVYEDLNYFLWQTFSRNIPLYVLCALGLLMAAARLRRCSPGARIALVFTAVIAALVYGYHPAPWPYNFIMAIPFLALWAPLPASAVVKASPRAMGMVMVLLLVILGPSIQRNIFYLSRDNGVQEQTVKLAESLLAPGEVYFDGVHMIPTRRHATSIWLQRSVLLRILDEARQGDTSIIEAVLAEQPKVWILSYRTRSIAPVLAPFLKASYVRVAPNILLAGVAVDGRSETVFRVPWGGDYALRSAAGKARDAMDLVVDGRAVQGGRVALSPGPHRLRLRGGEEGLFLLPAGIDLPFPAPEMQKQRALFANAHTF